MKNPSIHPRLSGAPSGQGGFTLVEFVGVIAIVAILASFSIAAIHRQVIETRRDAEDISLRGIAGGLSNVVRFNLTVPSSSTWVAAVASQLNRSQNEIGTNSLGNTRVVMVDPNFVIGSPASAFSSLPFTQTIAGSRQVQNLNFIILSSLADPLPSLVGVAYTNVWNSADSSLPTGWPASWKGKPEDLKRERVTLTGMFYRLVLNNMDSTNSAVWHMDGGSATTTLAPNTTKEIWVVDGTTLNLHETGGTLTTRDILHADASYLFMNNRWVQTVVPLTVAGGNPAATLVETTDVFLTTHNDTAAAAADGAAVEGPYDCEDTDNDHDGWGDHDWWHSRGRHGRNHCGRWTTNYDNDHDCNNDGWDDHDCNHDGWDDHDADHSHRDDDEEGHNGHCNPKANPKAVVENCFNFMRSYTSWAKNSGCAKTGNATQQYNQVCSHREQVRTSVKHCP